MQLAKGNSSAEKEEDAASRNSAVAPDLIPVLLVSGPQATGRSELVQRLIQEDDRLVAPTLVDKNQDGVTFERLTNRDEFLEVDPTGRFGLTKASILQAAANAAKDGDDDDGTTSKVVVVDANVSLARTLQFLSGAQLIGVWGGSNSIPELEERLKQESEAEDASNILPEEHHGNDKGGTTSKSNKPLENDADESNPPAEEGTFTEAAIF